MEGFAVICYRNQSTETPFTAFVTETWIERWIDREPETATTELACECGATQGEAVEAARFAAVAVLRKEGRSHAAEVMMETPTAFTAHPIFPEGK